MRLSKIKCLLLALFAFTISKCFSQSANESFYAFNKDWTAAPSLDKCTYFMQEIKKSDTEYICRYYNKLGPMIKQESYRDEALSMPNGFFCWYDENGKIDSCGQVLSFKKDGKWEYFLGDSTKLSYYEEYDKGKFIKRDSYHFSDTTSGENDTTEKEATFGNNKSSWDKYIETHLKVPDRFTRVIVKPGKYIVTVSFVVNKTGSVEQVVLLKSVEWSADAEVFRIIENSPAWQPATQKGKPVMYRQKQNLTFAVNDY